MNKFCYAIAMSIFAIGFGWIFVMFALIYCGALVADSIVGER